ncbi:NAD(P)/FAD-dependent oxidoreductase [Nocardia acidivorans]|uniref:NAD(P)/FAD-dependent oxidoreductase n=1 Tax=Nocardia acidivorans TaxID=404580 RepID=UPI0008331B6F|nr:FAD-dependent oxidoreductase [Nocardia acidivorans]
MTGSVAVVGASLAGLSAVRALRTRGFRGTITLIGEEPHLPYERPALSKEFLHTGEPIGLLEDHSETARLDAEWLLGRRAIGLTAATGRAGDSPASSTAEPHLIHLDDGRTVSADTVVLATGARPRRLAGASGAHYLRNLDDARALRESLSSTERLVVIGAGFIGAEVASSAHALGVDVTLIDAAPLPAAAVLGESVAAACAMLHARNGVRLLTGARIESLRPGAVHLTDGARLPADTLVVGIGSTPNTEWACDRNPLLQNGDGFHTDARARTSVPGIYAIGDCARAHDPRNGTHTRGEHWHAAIAQAHIAAATITGTPPPARTAPYFWSRQYGTLLQLAGDPTAATELRIVDGALDGESFTALYEHDGVPVAVCALDNPRLFTRHRKQLDRDPASAR